MRKFLAIVMIFSSLFIQSCSEGATPAAEGSMVVEFVIPSTAIDPFFIGELTINNVPTFYDENIALAGLSRDEVTSVTAGRAVLRSFQTLDLSFLQEISMKVVDRNSGTVREMYFLDMVRFNEGFSAELFGSLSELREIIEDPTIDILIEFEYRSIVPTDFRGEIEFTYLVFDE